MLSVTNMLSFGVLIVLMLNGVMLSVIILSVIILSVMTPYDERHIFNVMLSVILPIVIILSVASPAGECHPGYEANAIKIFISVIYKCLS
jgi:hypothetical protein